MVRHCGDVGLGGHAVARRQLSARAAGMGVGFNTPFQEQIDYLVQKLRLPTERWDDIARSAHDRAFVVAGATKADLLQDLHNAVVQRATDGKGLQQFRKDFKGIVAKHGWTGWTGEGSKAGEAWRTKVIYQTNMAQSHAAGRYRQMSDPDYVRLRPYWRYIHREGVRHPRPHHQAWHGLTLPHDHPLWQSHFAPNGWGCGCRIAAVSKAEGERSTAAGLGEPPDGWDAIDPKTDAPVGIDKGFDYAPGASVDVPLRKMVQDKLIAYPPAIGKALTADVNRYINTTQSPAEFVDGVLQDRQRTDPLWLGFVEDPASVNKAIQRDVTGYTLLLPADAPRHVQTHHGMDGGSQRPPTSDDYAMLASMLNDPTAMRAGETVDGFERLVTDKKVGAETFHAVWEIRPGKKNRALALVTFLIKTK